MTNIEISAFTASNVGPLMFPFETTNLDIIVQNSLTPASDTTYNLGQWGARYLQTFTENLHVKYIVTDIARHEIAIGAYSGQSDTLPVISWVFQQNSDTSRILNLASQGAVKLILNPGDGAPGLVMGDSSTNQGANSRITNLAYATDNLDACPRGQTVGFIQNAVNELVEYIGAEIEETYEELERHIGESVRYAICEDITFKDGTSPNFVNGFRAGNITAYTRPVGTRPNFDIIAMDNITPAGDVDYNLGQWGQRWEHAYVRTMHVEELLTDTSRSRLNDPGIHIGSYSGQNGGARESAWIFKPDPLDNSKLDFVSLQDNKLIASRIACASIGVVGEVKCDTIEATTGGYIPALDVDLLYVSDQMALNGKRITQVGAPEANTDVANKSYVDQSIQNAIDEITIPPSLDWRFPPIGALRWTAGFTDFVLRIEGDNPNLISDPEVRIILPSADSAVQLDYTYETWPHMMVGIEIDWQIRRRGTILPIVKQGNLVLGRNVANGLAFETDYDVTFIVYPTNPKGRGQTVEGSYFTYTLLGVEI